MLFRSLIEGLSKPKCHPDVHNMVPNLKMDGSRRPPVTAVRDVTEVDTISKEGMSTELPAGEEAVPNDARVVAN